VVQAVQELRVRQQTGLTPRLQQSVKLLQMSTLDFSREILRAAAENPFLCDGDDDGIEAAGASGERPDYSGQNESGSDSQPRDPESPAHDGAHEERAGPDPARDDLSYSGDYPTASGKSDGRESDIAQWARSQPDMRDILSAGLRNYRLEARDRALAEFIIDALDEDGYLRTALCDLAQAADFDPPAHAGEWETALKLVQQMDAPGLAARDLSECLCLQLNALPADIPGRELALRIAHDGLERVGRRDYQGLCRIFGCDESQARESCDLIRSMNPRPGLEFSTVSASDYVIPDAIVRRVGKVWKAMPNHATLPPTRLNGAYARLFRESRYADRSPMAQALQEACWLIRSIEQRFTTIQRVAQAIVARQQTFFEYGEIALRPLMLREIAEELGVHESTVSRATSNKYFTTPRGIYEFKHFFSREFTTSTGGTCSATAVRALIQEMIDAENPAEPLSDVVLARRLATEGVVVARRTVSKYRVQIKYPPAEQRRAH